MDRPPKKAKQNKNGPCREVTVDTLYWLNLYLQTYTFRHLILTEINEGILLSIEGYCVCRDRYAVFRKLPHSRKLYLCMNSASRIFFSASFLSVYEVVRTTKKNLRGWLVYIAHQHRTPNEWSKKLCELVSGHKRLTKNSAGNKLLLGS